MTIPSIRNYETRPPSGGWGIEYVFRGQKFSITGNWRTVTNKIANIQRRNGAFHGMDDVFEYCNTIWCSRDPERCMTPAQIGQAMKKTGTTCGRCGGRRRIR